MHLVKPARLLLISALLTGCAAGPGTQQETPRPLNAAESAALAEVARIGREIYARDIRAAAATDLLLTRIDPRVEGFVGWVTYPDEDGMTVSFYRVDGEAFVVMADVVFGNGRKPALTLDPDRKPSPVELSMIRARLAALRAAVNDCSQRFNTVILPSREPDAWDVYVLAATTQPKLVQLGGHTRVVVARKTGDVLQRETFARSCLALDKTAGQLQDAVEVVGLTVSHVVSEFPAPTHVFQSLLHGLTLYVVTSRGVFIVDEGRVAHSDIQP